MPTYEFKCGSEECPVDVFERDFKMADMPQETPCDCGAVGQKILSLFGSISTSDDPSFGSSKGEHRNREFSGFDPDGGLGGKHEGVTGWADRPKASKKDWEYA